MAGSLLFLAGRGLRAGPKIEKCWDFHKSVGHMCVVEALVVIRYIISPSFNLGKCP